MTKSIYAEPSFLDKLKGKIPKNVVSAGKAVIVSSKTAYGKGKQVYSDTSKSVTKVQSKINKVERTLFGSPIKAKKPKTRKPRTRVKTVYLMPTTQPYYAPPKQPTHKIDSRKFKAKSFWEKELG